MGGACMAVTVFKMSQISMTMVEGRIVKWLKTENEAVAEGEALVEIETDKIVVEITAPATGLMRKIMVQEGEYAAVDAPLCLIAEAADDISAYLAGQDGQAESTSVKSAETMLTPQASQPAGKVKISPLARKIADNMAWILQRLLAAVQGG